MMKPLQIGNLTVQKPIIQGGMGVAISLSGLASAVANQGGIGVISAAAIGMTEPDYKKNFRKANQNALRKHLRIARENTNGVIGVNLMVALNDYDELLEVSIKEGADVVIMGAGLPLKLPEFVLNQGFENIHTKFIPKVSSPKAAKLIFQYWASKFNHVPDAIVVEGPKAGGHLGFKKQELENSKTNLKDLVSETVKVAETFGEMFNKSIPVIAAGGIYTGMDMYEIMKYGASGVKMGTRFVTTYECDADIAFKMKYIESKEEDITLIDSPVGLPGRVINGDFVEKIARGETKPFKCPWKCLKSCNFKEAPYCISEVLHNSANGKFEEGFAFAGTNAYKATRIQTVKQVFDDIELGYKVKEYDMQPVRIAIQNRAFAV
ncbi:MAG: nitronate monooxygenase [Salinivirgaceae bacterium]|nr:MAG: nitronate monooxygenase [Salinivirgaceae bacterium]